MGIEIIKKKLFITLPVLLALLLAVCSCTALETTVTNTVTTTSTSTVTKISTVPTTVTETTTKTTTIASTTSEESSDTTVILSEERQSYTVKTVQLVNGEASFELSPSQRCSVVFYVDTMVNEDVDVSYTCVPADKMDSIWIEYSRPTSDELIEAVVGYNRPEFGIPRFTTGWYTVDFFYDKLNDTLPTVEIYIRVSW